MKSSFLLDCSGNVALPIRRLIFGLSALAVLASGGMAALTRATQNTYFLAGRTERPAFTFSQMDITNQATPETLAAGTSVIEKGRVYASKTPGFASTEHGQAVYNDRHVVGITPGANPAEAQVAYTTPGSDTPTTVSAAAFVAWVGEDVTGALPPANDKGQLGTGYNWRAYSGAAAQPGGDLAPADFVPGAGTPTTRASSIANAPKSQLATAPENSEKSPTTAPGVESLNVAQVKAAEDAGKPATPPQGPPPPPPANATAATPPVPAPEAPAPSGNLRERALSSMHAKNTTPNETTSN